MSTTAGAEGGARQHGPAAAQRKGRGERGSPALDDVRSSSPVERLMEDSWQTRSRRVGWRELIVETTAAVLFLAIAIPLASKALSTHQVDVPLALMLVGLYALASGMIRFPIGAGYVVPSYLVLVPMLLLLPPGVVPLLTAAALVAGTLCQLALTRAGSIERALFSIPDAWHTLGPVLVLLAVGPLHGGPVEPLVYVAAFLAGCLLDLLFATLRETAIMGIHSRVQLRVIALVWLIDASVAPLGLLVAHAARQHPAEILLILPLNAALLMVSRDRNTRIERAQTRLELVAHERTRLQTAVRRLGDALAARLDIEALTNIVLHGSIEALDADAGRLTLGGAVPARTVEAGVKPDVAGALRAAGEAARADERPRQLKREGVWALALPFGFATDAGRASGALAVARADRAFREDEESVMHDLIERATKAGAEIVSHQMLREQALTDSLTKLGNRRMLAADLEERMGRASGAQPLVLLLFDLDGFKSYNDTFGHLAGDAMLAHLGGKLSTALARNGTGYRLGGDEFCALLAAPQEQLRELITSAAAALREQGENFAVGSSYGAVLLPQEASSLDYALQLADERMYARKKDRRARSGDQTREMLRRIMQARNPSLRAHSSEVADLCLRVGRRLGMSAEALDELARAAELHDVGKVGIPDAILEKPEPLTAAEWEFVHQHTVLGERILGAAPALRPVGVIVRSTHERWDGRGYPDGLAGEAIPLGARVIAACDAYDAMITDRCYRGRRDDDEARAELARESGHQFDPRVVELLLDELEKAPPKASSRATAVDVDRETVDELIGLLGEPLERDATDGAPAGA